MANSADPLVDLLANDYADRLTSGTRHEDIEDAELFDELDTFDDSAYRAARMQQLSSELKSIKSLSPDHGTYMEIRDEKEVMQITTTHDHVVIHFFHPDFARCQIMDRHLLTLAQRHIHTRFIRVNVDNCPFLVTKLHVQVLPCIIPFIKALGKDRIIGFEGLGGDDFKTGTLELVLRKTGVIRNLRGDANLLGTKKSIMGFAEKEEDYDSDD